MNLPHASPTAGTPRLSAVTDDLWTARHPLRLLGMPMTAAMTVVRLASGGLCLHSPIPIDAALRRELDELGAVEWLIAPNRHHHLFAEACLKAYPAARLFVAPGLGAKIPGFAAFPVIPDAAAAPWRDEMDALLVAGNAEMNETVFFHKPTRSLIVTDLGVHLGPWDAFATRQYARLNGCYGRFGPTFLLKTLYRDQAAARASLRRILEWDFVRIVPAHGPVVEHEARAAFERAYAWLLRGG